MCYPSFKRHTAFVQYEILKSIKNKNCLDLCLPNRGWRHPGQPIFLKKLQENLEEIYLLAICKWVMKNDCMNVFITNTRLKRVKSLTILRLVTRDVVSNFWTSPTMTDNDNWHWHCAYVSLKSHLFKIFKHFGSVRFSISRQSWLNVS